MSFNVADLLLIGYISEEKIELHVSEMVTNCAALILKQENEPTVSELNRSKYLNFPDVEPKPKR